MWTTYHDYTKKMDNYCGTGLPGQNVYSRTNKVFGLSLDYASKLENIRILLKKEAASGDYQNHVLENNEKIFQEQIELFRLFFGNTKLSDEQRWEFIEDYFTGMSLEGLKEKIFLVLWNDSCKGCII